MKGKKKRKKVKKSEEEEELSLIDKVRPRKLDSILALKACR
jgi:hypothetical protein